MATLTVQISFIQSHAPGILKELIAQSYRQTIQSEMLELIKIIDFENAISWKSHTVIDLIASKPVIVSYNSDESI